MNENAHEGLELRVTAGLHAGAALPLDREPISIGSDEQCDVVLLDAGILPRHLGLICSDAGEWHTEPDGALIEIGKPIAIGESCIVVAPRSAPWAPAAGRAGLDAQPANVPITPIAHTSRHRGPVWLALALILAVIGVIGVIGVIVTWSLGAREDMQRAVQEHAISSITMPQAAKPSDENEIRRRAARELADRGLAELVTLDASPGRIHMEAELNDTELERFDRALRALQEQFGDEVEIDARVSPISHTLPFTIQSVVRGAASHITLADGQRVFEGSAVRGWRLEEIQPGKLVFVRRRRMEIPW
jgi:type III secretion protein D